MLVTRLLASLAMLCYVACNGITNLEQPGSNLTTNSCLLIGVPVVDRCQFITDNCEVETGIDYLSLYYCHWGGFTIVLLVLILFVSFVSLGLTASDFLCPNLYTISKFLKLSDNVAGLTLLAFGNGAPDVLSTFSALKIGSGSLAISELIGATFFIISVVIGIIAILHPFRVPKFQFFLNVLSLLWVLLVVMYALFAKLSVWVCFVLISSYLLYVGIAIFSHSYLHRRAKTTLLNQRSRSNFITNDTLSNLHEIYFPDFPTIEQFANEDEDEFDAHANLPGSYGLKLLLKDLSKHSRNSQSHRLGSVSSQDSRRPSAASASLDESPDLLQSQEDNATLQLNDSPIFQPYQDDPNASPDDLNIQIDDPYIKFLLILLPQLQEISRSNLMYKVYYIVTALISLVLRLSIPVRDESYITLLKQKSTDTDKDEDFDFAIDSQILTIQSFFGILVLSFVSFSGLNNYWKLVFPLTIIMSTAVSWLIMMNYKVDFSPSSYLKLKCIAYATAVLGFAVSIAWISVFATTIVNILRTISIIFSLSDEILGLTVFTIGNSLADFISNITMARMGMPLMAYGACFGGPLISLCSLGLSGFIIIPDSDFDYYHFEVNKTLLITLIVLVANILMLLYVVPRNNWMIDRKIGYILVSSWVLSTLICIILETL